MHDIPVRKYETASGCRSPTIKNTKPGWQLHRHDEAEEAESARRQHHSAARSSSSLVVPPPYTTQAALHYYPNAPLSENQELLVKKSRMKTTKVKDVCRAWRARCRSKARSSERGRAYILAGGLPIHSETIGSSRAHGILWSVRGRSPHCGHHVLHE